MVFFGDCVSSKSRSPPSQTAGRRSLPFASIPFGKGSFAQFLKENLKKNIKKFLKGNAFEEFKLCER